MKTNRSRVTPRTKQWYDKIISHYRETGYGMGVRELGKSFGCRSPVAAYYHLNILEQLGYVTRVRGRAHSIIPVEE